MFHESVIHLSCLSEIDCGRPPTVTNARASYNSTQLWAIATYSCNDGYEMEGQNTTQCTNNSIWASTLPACLRKL